MYRINQARDGRLAARAVAKLKSPSYSSRWIPTGRIAAHRVVLLGGVVPKPDRTDRAPTAAGSPRPARRGARRPGPLRRFGRPRASWSERRRRSRTTGGSPRRAPSARRARPAATRAQRGPRQRSRDSSTPRATTRGHYSSRHVGTCRCRRRRNTRGARPRRDCPSRIRGPSHSLHGSRSCPEVSPRPATRRRVRSGGWGSTRRSGPRRQGRGVRLVHGLHYGQVRVARQARICSLDKPRESSDVLRVTRDVIASRQGARLAATRAARAASLREPYRVVAVPTGHLP